MCIYIGTNTVRSNANDTPAQTKYLYKYYVLNYKEKRSNANKFHILHTYLCCGVKTCLNDDINDIYILLK